MDNSYETINSKILERQKDWKTEDTEPWLITDYSNAMFGEFGEAANKIKKLRRLQTKVKGNHDHENEEYLRKEIENELADGYQYLILLANAANVDLKNGIITTFNKKSYEIGSDVRI